MNHSFDVALATRFGVPEAIFIENLRFWILKNQANKKHFYEGRYWTYNSAKAYSELFPYWSKQQVERIISKLKDAGIIEIGHFSTNKYDRTNWYSLNDHALISQSPCIEIDESTNTDVNANIIGVTTKNTVNSNEHFDLFWKAYPRKTNKSFAEKVFKKIAFTEELFTQMMRALAKFPFSKDAQYIPHPSTWLNGKRWEDEVESTYTNQHAGAF